MIVQNDGWEIFELEELGELQRKTINPQDFKDVIFEEYSMPAFDAGGMPNIVKGKQLLSNRICISAPVLLFNKLNVRQKRVWLIGNTGSHAVCSTEFLAYHTKKVDLSLLKQILLTDEATSFFETRSTGTSNSQKRITPSIFLNYSIKIPDSLHEQRAIAAALSDVDALLDAQERLIAKKRHIKLAAMQQLLTGKTRLPGFQKPWIKKIFGEIFEFLPTTTYSRSQFVERGSIRNIHYGDILTKFSFLIDITKDKLPFLNEILSEKKYPERCFLQNGDVVIANTAEDLTVGKAVEVVNVDGKILSGQHTFLCRPKIRFGKRFLGYLINSKKFHGQLAAYVTGIKVSSISKTSLSCLFLEFPPSLDEQRAIAAVLSDMDAELAALEARRDKLRAVRQGMRQELLTGRTRLVGAGEQHGQ